MEKYDIKLKKKKDLEKIVQDIWKTKDSFNIQTCIVLLWTSKGETKNLETCENREDISQKSTTVQ